MILDENSDDLAMSETVCSAVTRIQTWVVSATTRSTNHYTITANWPVAGITSMLVYLWDSSDHKTRQTIKLGSDNAVFDNEQELNFSLTVQHLHKILVKFLNLRPLWQYSVSHQGIFLQYMTFSVGSE